MREIHNSIITTNSLNPAARTTSANGSSADLQGYEGAEIIVTAGLWTDGTHVFTLEESTNDSSFTDVATAEIIGTEPTIDAGAEDNMTYRFGYVGDARYIRVVQTITGSPGTGLISGAVIVRTMDRNAPTGASA